jgi:hypothetical protein
MSQYFKTFEAARLEARILAYLTSKPIFVKNYDQGWLVECHSNFAATRLALNLHLAPPETAPPWWSDVAKDWDAYCKGKNSELIKLEARGVTLGVVRLDGQPPRTMTDQEYWWATEGKHEAAEEDRLQSDPSYQEDLAHAHRANFVRDLVEASNDAESAGRLLNDWDERFPERHKIPNKGRPDDDDYAPHGKFRCSSCGGSGNADYGHRCIRCNGTGFETR